MNFRKNLIKIFLICFTVFIPLQSFAGLVPCVGPRADGGPKCDLNAVGTLLVNIIKFAINIGLVLSAIGFAWAGFLYMTAAGNSSQISKAHGVFKKILFGFLFAISAYLIVDLIAAAFGLKSTPTGREIIELYNRVIR
ncbi:MAG TPA: hypothetical protein PJ997_00630 [Candidatus Paceibacterota bacterium]|nr:hypothetical protein [Candidatus Paceibacterota bacterium]HMP18831.1 hypothetical protein [Candidatus Paceibacterota bacterium]HMP85553.1 hypothetical protein [Candidatus Paceibacterota bacterium]